MADRVRLPDEPAGWDLRCALVDPGAYLRQSFAIARAHPRIEMLLWFLLRDEGDPARWQSGLISARGERSPRIPPSVPSWRSSAASPFGSEGVCPDVREGRGGSGPDMSETGVPVAAPLSALLPAEHAESHPDSGRPCRTCGTCSAGPGGSGSDTSRTTGERSYASSRASSRSRSRETRRITSSEMAPARRSSSTASRSAASSSRRKRW